MRAPRMRLASIASAGLFPNKQALIYAIHSRIVERSWVEVQQTLDHRKWSARKKIDRIARLFFVAESSDVAEMGAALQEAEIYFADQPEYRAMEDQVLRRFAAFVRDALSPGASTSQVEFFAQLLVTVLESVGKSVASRGHPRHVVSRWARECAEMLADHIGLQGPRKHRAPRHS